MPTRGQDGSSRLARLSERRATCDRSAPIRDALRIEMDQLVRSSGGVGGASAALAEAPEVVRNGVEVVSVTGGIVSLKPANASVRFLLERWLASGGRAAVLASARARRVRTVG